MLRPTKRNIIDFVQKKSPKKFRLLKTRFGLYFFNCATKLPKPLFAKDNLIFIAAGKSPLKWILGWY